MDQDHTNEGDAAAGEVVGGGPTAPAHDPVARVLAHLELLSEPAREQVLAKMNPAIAEKLRMRMASTPDRPHGDFSHDIAAKRRLAREMAERIHAQKTVEVEQRTAASARDAARPDLARSAQPMAPGTMAPAATAAALAPSDPLDALRTLHPAAIARAMQGERAEAWAIVLDRLDEHSRSALGMYLDETAQRAIADARIRQAELAATSPVLIATIEAAIARTVVPRAMREHHGLLSTTPVAWAGGMPGTVSA